MIGGLPTCLDSPTIDVLGLAHALMLTYSGMKDDLGLSPTCQRRAYSATDEPTQILSGRRQGLDDEALEVACVVLLLAGVESSYVPGVAKTADGERSFH
jgi:hypothetical protein